jgi:Flp pilus assembly protein TadG
VSDEGTAGESEASQAAVEFALALPIAVLVILAIAQMGVSVRNEIAVELAAREGARAASAAADAPGAASAAARRAVDLPIDVHTAVSGDTVTVTVTYIDTTDVAIIGPAIGAITHRASATMTLEPP